MTERIACGIAAGVLALAACGGGGPAEPPPCPEPAAAAFAAPGPLDTTVTPFDAEFAAAAREFDVPVTLLKALGWVETRWRMVEGAEEFPGLPPAFGVMALRGERLARGAALAGVPIEAARREPLANIRAAAALLDGHARDEGIDRSRGDAWTAVIARFSAIEVAEGRRAYVAAVARGLTAGRHAAAPAIEPCPEPPPAVGPDYAPSLWRPSPNFDARAPDSTGAVHLVIIHTCEGNYTGCWSWLVNPVSEVSAHYVVDEDGAEISQLVREADRAWHIAALYDCTLNHGHDCWLNDTQSNHFTVGIEHAGFASQDSFPASQLDASAALVCDVTRDRGIPRDWQHIVAHGQLQPQNRTDPGPNWPWVPYLHAIQRHCGEVVVDDDAGYNDGTAAAVAAPVEWIASDSTTGYYGGGYRWASTRDDATDFVEFSFYVEQAGPRTLDARWTSGANRTPAASYTVIDAAGDTLATVTVDQTGGGGGGGGGGGWHTLGTWTFPAGWNRVALSRRGSPGFVVVADAVRARRQ